nr:hypothetical protein [Mesorhizobium sp.]
MAWTLRPPRFAAAEPSESRSAAQGNRKTELQENSAHKPRILQFQSRYPPQSTCQINGLRIVHGRLRTTFATSMKSHGDRQQYRRRPAAPCEIADMGVEADHGEEVDEQDVARRQVEIDLDTGEEIDPIATEK